MRRYIFILLTLTLLLSATACKALTLEEQFEKELRAFRFQKCQVILQDFLTNFVYCLGLKITAFNHSEHLIYYY